MSLMVPNMGQDNSDSGLQHLISTYLLSPVIQSVKFSTKCGFAGPKSGNTQFLPKNSSKEEICSQYQKIDSFFQLVF